MIRPLSRIYLDYASLTPIDRRVMRDMKKYSSTAYANPSSLYKEGVAARTAAEDMRRRTAGFLHAHADEIIFTSGGTEANGLALEGAGRAARRAGIAQPHLIISAIEHSSIMAAAEMMEKHGVTVTRLPVDASGRVSAEDVKKALTPNTFMVSIMAVNNEIGSIQPLQEIAKAIRQARASFKTPAHARYPLFHTDAAQAALYGNLAVDKLGIDVMTLDGGKIYGPRGIGCLYVRRGTPIEQIIYGGGQESGLRSGTENLPAIAGFARALELAAAGREKETERIAALKESFIAGLQKIRPDIKFITPPAPLSAPHILNVSIPGIDNEFFVLQLDARGIACSTKSSCLRDADESYVLSAVGAESATAVRFSFGRWTRPADLKRVLLAIYDILC